MSFVSKTGTSFLFVTIKYSKCVFDDLPYGPSLRRWGPSCWRIWVWRKGGVQQGVAVGARVPWYSPFVVLSRVVGRHGSYRLTAKEASGFVKNFSLVQGIWLLLMDEDGVSFGAFAFMSVFTGRRYVACLLLNDCRQWVPCETNRLCVSSIGVDINIPKPEFLSCELMRKIDDEKPF